VTGSWYNRQRYILCDVNSEVPFRCLAPGGINLSSIYHRLLTFRDHRGVLPCDITLYIFLNSIIREAWRQILYCLLCAFDIPSDFVSWSLWQPRTSVHSATPWNYRSRFRKSDFFFETQSETLPHKKLGLTVRLNKALGSDIWVRTYNCGSSASIGLKTYRKGLKAHRIVRLWLLARRGAAETIQLHKRLQDIEDELSVLREHSPQSTDSRKTLSELRMCEDLVRSEPIPSAFFSSSATRTPALCKSQHLARQTLAKLTLSIEGSVRVPKTVIARFSSNDTRMREELIMHWVPFAILGKKINNIKVGILSVGKQSFSVKILNLSAVPLASGGTKQSYDIVVEVVESLRCNPTCAGRFLIAIGW